MRVFAQDDIETEATVGNQHLTAIPFTDGSDLLREENSALEQVHAAEELDAARFEIPLGKVGKLEIKPPKTALFCEMMNRKHGSERQLLVVHQHGNEGRRPIVH